MNYSCTFFVFLLCINASFGQINEIDSLISLLKSSDQDTAKLRILVDLSNATELKESIEYGEAAEKLADKLLLLKNANRKNILNRKGSAINNIGYAYMTMGNTSKGLENYFRCLKIKEEVGDKMGQAESLNNIGFVISEQGDINSALKYYEKSLMIHNEINNKEGASLLLYNIGCIYKDQKDSAMALPYFRKALAISEELKDKTGIAWTLNCIGLIYYDVSDLPKARNYFLSAKKICEETDDLTGISSSCGNLGNICLQEKKYSEAKENFACCLQNATKSGSHSHIQIAEFYLYKLYSATGNYKEAILHYQKNIEYRDSLNSSANTKKIVQSQMNYEFEKKEAVAGALHKKELEDQQTKADEKSRKQAIVTWSVVSGLVSVLVFAGFIFRTLKITRRQKEIIETQKSEVEVQKLIVEEHQKEIIDSITYARRIQRSLLPTEKYIEKTLSRLRKL